MKCVFALVVVLDDARAAVPLAGALCEGLSCAEVMSQTEAAEESIRLMPEEFPNMRVDAGTVLPGDQVDHAVKAGALYDSLTDSERIPVYRNTASALKNTVAGDLLVMNLPEVQMLIKEHAEGGSQIEMKR